MGGVKKCQWVLPYHPYLLYVHNHKMRTPRKPPQFHLHRPPRAFYLVYLPQDVVDSQGL